MGHLLATAAPFLTPGGRRDGIRILAGRLVQGRAIARYVFPTVCPSAEPRSDSPSTMVGIPDPGSLIGTIRSKAGRPPVPAVPVFGTSSVRRGQRHVGVVQLPVLRPGSVPSPLRAGDTGRPPASTTKQIGVETAAPAENPPVQVAITQTSHHDASPEMTLLSRGSSDMPVM